MVGAAKLGSDLEATNRAVGVSGSAHTKAALARGRDAVVEGDRSVVEADVEERRLLGVNDGGLAQDGLRRRRLVQEAVGGRQEQGSYEVGLRCRTTVSEGAGVAPPRVDGWGAESRSKTWGEGWGVTPPSRRRRGERHILPEAAETARTSRAASNSLWSACEREREQAAVAQGPILRGKRLFRLRGVRDAFSAVSKGENRVS